MNCPLCKSRGWVRSGRPGRLVDRCRHCAGHGEVRPLSLLRRVFGAPPPGWVWGVAVFIGIMLGNAIVPNAHGAPLSSAEPHGDAITMALVGLAIGFGAVAIALYAALRAAPLDPEEPTPAEQRAEAWRDACEARRARTPPRGVEHQASQQADRRTRSRRAE